MAEAAHSGNPDPAGFGVYVHWPFCAAKCPYCDFNSHVRPGLDEARFRDGLLREIATWAAATPGRTVTSIFLGGGTPSLMAPATVKAVLAAVAADWAVADGAEITLEANPSSVEASRFEGYRAAGINRVSLGVQSFDDAELKRLGRLHDAAQARAAIATAAATFQRFSFDLIYARPGQTLAQWQAELAAALALGPAHLSAYQLTIEPDTPYAELHRRGKLTVPDPDTAHALFALTQDMCAAAGLPAYEISNHARPGEESRHNLLYWRYGEYVGVGAGAHGRVILDGVRTATSTERRPEAWLERVEREGMGVTERAPLARAEQVDEALLMGLRLTEGLDLARLAALGGVAPSQQAVEALSSLGLLERPRAGRIRATAEGRFVLNEIVLRLSQGLAAV
ncbi:MAG: radical SAM family heme chaperone HemW [Hyphomicrobiaceae bacterium]|nr:radical SAM family heme chaperone HemW [Hyphomicrobiaceae bacterium]